MIEYESKSLENSYQVEYTMEGIFFTTLIAAHRRTADHTFSVCLSSEAANPNR